MFSYTYPIHHEKLKKTLSKAVCFLLECTHIYINNYTYTVIHIQLYIHTAIHTYRYTHIYSLISTNKLFLDMSITKKQNNNITINFHIISS